jgi:Methyltransferase domain
MLRDTLRETRIRWHQAGAFWKCIRAARRGCTMWRAHGDWQRDGNGVCPAVKPNPLREFFDARKEGRGIWKWNHYFDIYDSHFSRFRGTKVHVVEIGVYSGGSLEMWQSYFGPQSTIHGVDIEPVCKAYEAPAVHIHIGDQADRNFWRRFKQEVPTIHIVIDDGGHKSDQQIVTLEELLPHLQPGGIYLCEDLHRLRNPFSSYVYGLAENLNASESCLLSLSDNEHRFVCEASPSQQAIRAIHLYPYVAVIERTAEPLTELVAPKHGTQWQPFLS